MATERGFKPQLFHSANPGASIYRRTFNFSLISSHTLSGSRTIAGKMKSVTYIKFRVWTLAALNCAGAKNQPLLLLLTLSAALWLPLVSANDTTLDQPFKHYVTTTAQSSCASIKDNNNPTWTVDDRNTLLPKSVTTSPYTNPRGLTGVRLKGSTEQGATVVWTTIQSVAGLSSMQIETSIENHPQSQWVLDANCTVVQHRQLVYNDDFTAIALLVIDPANGATITTELLNPPLPVPSKISTDSKRIRIGLVDSGVNYTLPQINARLARDNKGQLVGYDFWDNDALPFDVHFSASPFRISRHGTGTASLLLKEASFIDLVPYRYPRPDMSRMENLIEHAANNQVRIIGLPLGGNIAAEWDSFAAAAKKHPNILFIASAGNNGRNIDQQPVYPASLDIDNLLVVTSADDFVVPADRVNWGRSKVDYMLPAEEQPVTDFNGNNATASGSSYAVPRAAALAAKFLRDNPDWHASDLIAEFARRYADGSSSRYVGGGYIADPAAEDTLEVKLVGVQTLTREKPVEQNPEQRVYKLPLSVFVLHEGWSKELVRNSLLEAEAILAQCNIALNSVTISELSMPAYLRDLETGSAKTLISALNNDTQFKPIKIFYARDTRMQTKFDGEAFGRGNTRRRPWMQDSVWLMNGIKDTGIALAHELFHVLSNSGEHIQSGDNLMQTRTSAGNTVLDPLQCSVAINNAKEHQILFD